MSAERRVFDKEDKLMSVELGNIRTDLGALAKRIGCSTGDAIPLAQRVFCKIK